MTAPNVIVNIFAAYTVDKSVEMVCCGNAKQEYGEVLWLF
jgi:hypothetical protein